MPTNLGEQAVVPQEHAPAELREIELRVTDQHLAPLADARVECLSGAVSVVQRTDARGECRLQAERGADSVHLDVSHEGFAHVRAHWTNRPRLEVSLRRAIAVAGSVLDATTGAPILGARVGLVHEACKGCEPSTVAADPNGSYRLTGVPFDRARFRVTAPDYPPHVVSLELDEAGDHARCDFRLQRGVRVHGRVVDFTRGTALEAATVGDGDHQLFTDARGAFDGRFLTLPDGRLGLMVASKGRCRLIVQLAREELALGEALELRLPEGPFIEGSVRDPAGLPVRGARVTVEPDHQAVDVDDSAGSAPVIDIPASWKWFDAYTTFTESTDDNGRFRVAGLAPWSPGRRVTARAKGFRAATVAVGRLPGPGGSVWGELVLEPEAEPTSGSIEGAVWVNGLSFAASVSWSAGALSGEAPTSIGRGYRVEGLPPGPVELTVKVPGFSEVIEGHTASLEIRAGETLRQDFELRIPEAPIRGRVLFADGTPAAGATVSAMAPRQVLGQTMWRPVGRSSCTDSGGSFGFELPVQDLGYRIAASNGAANADSEVVPTGSSDVVIVLPSRGSLLFRAIDARTLMPIEYASLHLEGRRGSVVRFEPLVETPMQSQADGWSRLEFEKGELELIVCGTHAGYQSARVNAMILDHAETRLEVVLEPALRLRFRLDPPPDASWSERFVLVVEPERWDAIRMTGAAGSPSLETGPAFTLDTLRERRLTFDPKGLAELGGLGPGKYRFKVLPDDYPLEPATIEVTGDTEEPIVLRWK